MSKFGEIDPALLQRAVVAVQQCWNEGSPVAGSSPDGWHEVAHEAIRRIRSFERRKLSQSDRTVKVKDVARRLADQFESRPDLVGPLIVDYEYVAAKVLDVVAPEAT